MFKNKGVRTMDEKCNNYEVREGHEVCIYFTGDMWIQGQLIKCKCYCSYFRKMMEERSEIDVGKCK